MELVSSNAENEQALKKSTDELNNKKLALEEAMK